MLKPKLCCILNPVITCHCGLHLCPAHDMNILDHITPRPNTPYYYHCGTDPLAVVWLDRSKELDQYKLAFYENQETKEDTCEEVVGQTKPGNSHRRRQKEVPKIKRKRRVA